MQHDQPIRIVLGQTLVVRRREREVGHVAAVDIENDEGEVIRPTLLGDRRRDKDAGTLETHEIVSPGRGRRLEALRAHRIADARRTPARKLYSPGSGRSSPFGHRNVLLNSRNIHLVARGEWWAPSFRSRAPISAAQRS